MDGGVNLTSYVTRIEWIEADARNTDVKIDVRWYYRPEESIGGHRQFHGSKEVFLSYHFDVQSADTVKARCTVHSFKSYTKLNAIGNDDFFYRFEYNSFTGAFNPDRVAIWKMLFFCFVENVMGFLLAANGLLVLYIAINLFKIYYGDDWGGLFEAITSYGLGGSSMALFGSVVDGGIYTKVADVGVDLVRKVERNIPEDDPRNLAVYSSALGLVRSMVCTHYSKLC
ncbi:Chromatin remodeling protein SHL [Glycine max]|nr:Chromatin remodeling protein SHL [Glycine max]